MKAGDFSPCRFGLGTLLSFLSAHTAHGQAAPHVLQLKSRPGNRERLRLRPLQCLHRYQSLAPKPLFSSQLAFLGLFLTTLISSGKAVVEPVCAFTPKQHLVKQELFRASQQLGGNVVRPHVGSVGSFWLRKRREKLHHAQPGRAAKPPARGFGMAKVSALQHRGPGPITRTRTCTRTHHQDHQQDQDQDLDLNHDLDQDQDKTRTGPDLSFSCPLPSDASSFSPSTVKTQILPFCSVNQVIGLQLMVI